MPIVPVGFGSNDSACAYTPETGANKCTGHRVAVKVLDRRRSLIAVTQNRQADTTKSATKIPEIKITPVCPVAPKNCFSCGISVRRTVNAPVDNRTCTASPTGLFDHPVRRLAPPRDVPPKTRPMAEGCISSANIAVPHRDAHQASSAAPQRAATESECILGDNAGVGASQAVDERGRGQPSRPRNNLRNSGLGASHWFGGAVVECSPVADFRSPGCVSVRWRLGQYNQIVRIQ